MKWFAFLLLLPMLAVAPASADENGARLFAPCRACHSLDPTERGLPGPNLAGVAGRVVAGDPAFDYSPVLQEARAKGEVWTKDKLDLYLSDPQAVYAGTWMGSPPIRDAKQRADILCVLGGR